PCWMGRRVIRPAVWAEASWLSNRASPTANPPPRASFQVCAPTFMVTPRIRKRMTSPREVAPVAPPRCGHQPSLITAPARTRHQKSWRAINARADSLLRYLYFNPHPMSNHLIVTRRRIREQSGLSGVLRMVRHWLPQGGAGGWGWLA